MKMENTFVHLNLRLIHFFIFFESFPSEPFPSPLRFTVLDLHSGSSSGASFDAVTNVHSVNSTLCSSQLTLESTKTNRKGTFLNL